MMLNEMDIRWVVERVVALCDPDSVHVCGSYATGAAHAGSDLDLLIILPSTLPRWHRGKVLKHALSSFPCHFDLLIFTPQELAEDLKDPYSFLSAITASGRLVYRKELKKITPALQEEGITVSVPPETSLVTLSRKAE